jgi:VanZ family protein
MSSSRRGLTYWISAWLPVAIGIAVIATESTKYFGSDRTSGPFRWLYQMIFGVVSDDQWGVIHHLIRKTGHFLGYGLIGLAWLRAWRMTLLQAKLIYQAILALAGTALLASWDEWHQSFLPNRTSSPWDVLIDCCGAAAMMTIAAAWLRRRGATR